jgi:predicted enzyme related to lactoylglutathione lyase
MANNNTITHIEIPAPDLEKAIAFYSKLFNWEIEKFPGGDYAFFRVGDTQSGGGFDAGLKPAEEKYGVQVTIDVDDISAKLEEIEIAGGRIVLGKTEIPGGHGFYACFCDPNGNYLQLHARE